MSALQLSTHRLRSLAPATSWPDLLGPYIVGICAAKAFPAPILPAIILLGLYFSFPAASLLSGLDRAFNSKRTKLSAGAFKWFGETMVWLHLPIILLVPFLPYAALLGLVGFWVLGIFYLVPPVEAKRRWLLDAVFATYPTFAALVGYGLISLKVPDPSIMLAVLLWYAARRLKIAVMDPGESLTTEWLGLRPSLILSGAMWVAGGLLLKSELGWLSIGIGMSFGLATIQEVYWSHDRSKNWLDATWRYGEWLSYVLVAGWAALR